MSMNITMMIALALALSAAPSVGAIRTHRRATGTELYRVQPTQKVMPVADASPMNAADFEKLDGDAKRALSELMVGRKLEGYYSMVESFEPILSLSYAPIMSMTPAPTYPPEIEEDESTGGSAAALNSAAGSVGANGEANGFNKPATISVTVFLLIAAVAVTALVVRKYKRVVMMSGADDQSIMTGSVFSNQPV